MTTRGSSPEKNGQWGGEEAVCWGVEDVGSVVVDDGEDGALVVLRDNKDTKTNPDVVCPKHCPCFEGVLCQPHPNTSATASLARRTQLDLKVKPRKLAGNPTHQPSRSLLSRGVEFHNIRHNNSTTRQTVSCLKQQVGRLAQQRRCGAKKRDATSSFAGTCRTTWTATSGRFCTLSSARPWRRLLPSSPSNLLAASCGNSKGSSETKRKPVEMKPSKGGSCSICFGFHSCFVSIFKE